MKFPRNARLLRSPFEIAPFATVFFLLVIFLLLGELMPIPGVPLQLQPPDAGDLPGINAPTVAVAVDSSGRLFFTNQLVSVPQLAAGLSNAVKNAQAPLTLVIHADKSVTYNQLMELTLLARTNGITNALLTTLPRTINVTAKPER
jgi:biopolymer transport protein ExbD